MFLLFLLSLSSGLVLPLNNAEIYMDVIGKMLFSPSNCSVSCQNNCLACNLTTLSDCSFTDQLIVKNGSVGFYDTMPNKSCQREHLYIYTPGLYRLTINKYGEYLQFIPYKISDYAYLSVTFILGYSFS